MLVSLFYYFSFVLNVESKWRVIWLYKNSKFYRRMSFEAFGKTSFSFVFQVKCWKLKSFLILLSIVKLKSFEGTFICLFVSTSMILTPQWFFSFIHMNFIPSPFRCITFVYTCDFIHRMHSWLAHRYFIIFSKRFFHELSAKSVVAI